MSLFQVQPATPFDLRFSIAGFAIRVHPLFWLIALLFGSSYPLIVIPIWVFVVFVSIIVHELGHALAFRRYGIRSQILLHAMGGLTIPESTPWGTGYASVSLTPMQQIIISLAGPFAGFFFAVLVILAVKFSGGAIHMSKLFGILPLPDSAEMTIGRPLTGILMTMFLWVNIYWGLINLMPVFPLDGGQVARNALLQYDPIDGVRKSLWVSVIAGVLLAVIGLLFWKSTYMAFLFGLLAFQSFQALQYRY